MNAPSPPHPEPPPDADELVAVITAAVTGALGTPVRIVGVWTPGGATTERWARDGRSALSPGSPITRRTPPRHRDHSP